MTAHDTEVLHGRISELKDAVSDLTVEVRANIALCQQCRPKVIGNGHPSFEARLATVETRQYVTGLLLTRLVAIAAAVSSSITAVVLWVLNHMLPPATS